MKRILVLLFLLSITGCGSTLHELRNSNPEKIEMIRKDTFCVYGKLNSAAIINNNASPNVLNFGSDIVVTWQTNWDPVTKKGIILGIAHEATSAYPILFNIHGYENVTKIEIRVDNKSGIRRIPYQQQAERIILSADFSSCPDL